MTRLDLADGLRLIHGASGREDHFGHEAHLRFVWALLDEAADTEEAERVACLTISHAAELADNPDKYNCTVTLFWTRLAAHVRSEHHEAATLEDAFDVFPDLRDPHLPDRHWSNINSAEAKQRWVEPDLAPMP